MTADNTLTGPTYFLNVCADAGFYAGKRIKTVNCRLCPKYTVFVSEKKLLLWLFLIK